MAAKKAYAIVYWSHKEPEAKDYNLASGDDSVLRELSMRKNVKHVELFEHSTHEKLATYTKGNRHYTVHFQEMWPKKMKECHKRLIKAGLL